MFKRFLLFFLLIGGALGVVAYFKYQQMQAMEAQMSQGQPPATVASAEVESASWRPAFTSVGSLQAVNGIQLSAEVSGIVKAIRFESGDRVQQGDVLLELDDDVHQAGLEALKADRELARVEFSRAQELLPKKAVSRSEYDQAQANLQAADARVAEQQAVIALKTLRAPFDGELGIRQADLGQFLQPGVPIVSLQALAPIYADFSLPERYFADLKKDMEVEFSAAGYPDETFVGRISAIEPGIDEGARSVNLRATLANADGRLRPGMFVQVRVLQPESQTFLVLPRTAISYNTYGDFVYLLQDNDEGRLTAKRKQVTTGAVRAGRVVIESGLEAGQQVVRAGLVKLRDGQAVEIDNSVELNDGEVVTE